MKPFRDFMKSDTEALRLKEMALGSVRKELSLPIPTNMAYFIALFGADNLERTKVFEWLLNEGLLQASSGRDQLVEIINGALNIVSIPGQGDQSGQVTTGKAVGESNLSEGEIRSLRSKSRAIEAVDLFSPIARKEMAKTFNDPRVKKSLGGMDIDNYYAKNYEPQYMEIPNRRAKGNKYIEIQEVNAELAKKGIEPFKYGGVDGYLQYVEKGDWQEESQKRNYQDPNQQHGPDLSGARREVQDGKPIIKFGDGGNTVNTNIRRYSAVLQGMERKFRKFDQDPKGMGDKEIKILRGIKGIKKMERIAKEGRASVTTVCYNLVQKTTGGWKQTCDQELEEVLEYARIGLKKPFPIGAHTLTRDSWNNFASDKVGLGITGKPASETDRHQYVWVTLTDAQVETVMNHVTKDQDKGFLNVTWWWGTILRETGIEKVPTSQGAARAFLSRFVEAGLRNNPDVYKTKTVTSHELTGIPDLQHSPKIEERPVSNNDIENLKFRGYQWSLSDKDIAKGLKEPDWESHLFDEPETLIFGDDENIQHIIKIVKRVDPYNPNSYELKMQVPQAEQEKRGARRNLSRPMLLGGKGTNISGGENLGIGDENPSQNWEELEKQLLNGEIGEKYDLKGDEGDEGEYSKSFGDVHALPSVKSGISTSLRHALTWSYQDYVPQNRGDKDKLIGHDDLLRWAVKALWNFSGDQAFHFGYLTDEDFEGILKWDQEGQRVGSSQKPDEDIFDTEGQGIWSLLQKAGISDSNKQKKYVAKVVKLMKGGGVWEDLKDLGLPENVIASIGRNAKHARIRQVTKFVDANIQKEVNERRKSRVKSATDVAGKPVDSDERQGTEDALQKGVAVSRLPKQIEIEPNPMSPEGLRAGHIDPRQQNPDVATTRIPDRVPDKLTEPQTIAAQGIDEPAAPVRPAPVRPAPKIAPVRVAAQGTDDFFNSIKEPETAPVVRPVSQPKLARQPIARKPPPTQVLQGDDWWDSVKERSQGNDFLNALNERLLNYKIWREMAGTGAVYDGTPPKDGGGFNWWGTVGHPLGVSISGDADTSKEDPTGKKGKKHGRKRKKG